MYKVKLTGRYELAGGGLAFSLESPVAAERTFAGMAEAIGPQIEIDGTVYDIISFELFPLIRPVFHGDDIALHVRPK